MNQVHLRWPRLFATCVVTTGLMLCLNGCMHGSGRSPERTLRVMTYNIHHAEGVDGKIDVLRIAELIRHEQADIIALQEVDRGVERTQRRDLSAELAALSGMSCVFSNNYTFQGGEYGNALLTRFPIKRWSNTHLRMLQPGEQRGALQVVLEVNGHELVIINTHLDHRPNDAERMFSITQILPLSARHLPSPVVLCGDFNDTPGSRVYQKLSESFDDAWAVAGDGDGFTIPSQAPRKRIDYLWLSKGAALRPVRLWVVESPAFDHLPLLGEFRLPPAR